MSWKERALTAYAESVREADPLKIRVTEWDDPEQGACYVYVWPVTFAQLHAIRGEHENGDVPTLIMTIIQRCRDSEGNWLFSSKDMPAMMGREVGSDRMGIDPKTAARISTAIQRWDISRDRVEGVSLGES